VEFLLDEMWMSKLAYLVDTFFHLNKLTRVQGFCTNICRVFAQISLCWETGHGIQTKLALWDNFVQKGNTEKFTTLNYIWQALMSMLKRYYWKHNKSTFVEVILQHWLAYIIVLNMRILEMKP